MLALLAFILAALAGVFLAPPIGYVLAVLLVLAGLLVGGSLKMANQWEKAIVLRFGRLHNVRGAGAVPDRAGDRPGGGMGSTSASRPPRSTPSRR